MNVAQSVSMESATTLTPSAHLPVVTWLLLAQAELVMRLFVGLLLKAEELVSRVPKAVILFLLVPVAPPTNARTVVFVLSTLAAAFQSVPKEEFSACRRKLASCTIEIQPRRRSLSVVCGDESFRMV